MADSKEQSTGNSGLGNGLGANKVAPFNPGSVGDYKRGLQDGFVKPAESEMRKGAGAKQ